MRFRCDWCGRDLNLIERLAWARAVAPLHSAQAGPTSILYPGINTNATTISCAGCHASFEAGPDFTLDVI